MVGKLTEQLQRAGLSGPDAFLNALVIATSDRVDAAAVSAKLEEDLKEAEGFRELSF